jgi:hypothetical protein
VNGGVGILFEQASARGFAQKTINGKLTFKDAVKNQLSASLSTLSGALANRKALLDHQSDFYASYKKLADDDDVSGYVLSEKHDQSRLTELLSLLGSHQINVYPLSKDLKANNKQFNRNTSYYVPLAQPQYRLIKSIFSQVKSFNDNTFYDVSSWNLAYAFNIDFESIDSDWGLKYDATPWQKPQAPKLAKLGKSYAYAFEWNDQKAPLLLQQLLGQKIVLRVATKGFTAITHTGQKKYAAGTIIVNRGLQKGSDWLSILQRAQDEVGLELDTLTSGLTTNGIDLGSRSMMPVDLPKILLLGGNGTTSYEVGEIWHFLNKQLALAPTIVEVDRLSRINLDNYTHLIMANGSYGGINDKMVTKLTRWVKGGGVIWGQKNAAKWLVDKELLKATLTTAAEMGKRLDKKILPYGQQDSHNARKRIAGAIFSVELDLTHPLTYGYHQATLPVFKNSTLVLNKATKSFVTVGTYSKYPQLSGYADKTNVAKIAQSSFMLAQSLDNGTVIGVADNVNFRGFWYGTSRLMTNSLYFSHIVDASAQ